MTVDTVRRWLKAGKLKGTRYWRGRSEFSSSPPRIWVVERESVDQLIAERMESQKGRKAKR